MPTYVYQTVPSDPSSPVERYEVQQKMSEAALTQHPETGEPIERVILGGFGMVKGAGDVPVRAPQSTHSGPMRCGSGTCGCH